MRYIINRILFKKRLFEAGYTSLFNFSRRTKIHRNTILNYLAGRDVFAPIIGQVATALSADPLELIMPVSEGTVRLPLLDEIGLIIAKIVKADGHIAVILIGSRAARRARDYSDWDIGITRGQSPLATMEYLKIKDMVDELAEDIPRMIDVVNLDAAPAWFLKGLDYEPIFLGGDRESYLYFKGVLYGVKKREGQT